MLGRWGRAAAERLERCLSGDAVPDDPDTAKMVMAASALAPRTPISEDARSRAFEAMMREADRRARPLPAGPAEDLTDPGVHARIAQAGDVEIRVANIEAIPDSDLEDIAARLAARFKQNAPDRNQ
ncbi:hypothetical protein [Streptomyces sp. NPDC097619]|uniref:hypothetical protein n=1 Tax=Streptomyces sp. NPDC097619 TaxID=3157228 RepID=UPI00331F4A83